MLRLLHHFGRLALTTSRLEFGAVAAATLLVLSLLLLVLMLP